jgi:hypothetical protein
MEDPKNKSIFDSISSLQSALSLGSYGFGGGMSCGCGTSHIHDPNRTNRDRFFNMLLKLGLKSPPSPSANHIAIESIDAILKSVTFDDSALKLWKNPSGKKDP